MKSLKIIELQAENVKRLRAVQITPRGNVVQIVGANGAGKSSILDAIQFALGGAGAIDAMPVRQGEQKARIRLDLGDIIVTRKWTPKGSELIVESAEGARYPSPQTMLDALVGAYTLDPLAFARQTPKQQAETLRALVPLDVDVDALDARAKEAYEERTRVNREVKSATERVLQLSTAVDRAMDVAPIDIAALLTEMEHASTHNANIARVANARQREEIKRDEYRNRAAVLRERIQQLTEEAEGYEAAAEKIDAELAADTALPTEIDVSELRAQIEAAQAGNAARDRQRFARAQHQQAADQLTAAQITADTLTAEIDDCQRQKAEAIARAKMPLQGLAFTADGVTYRGIPLEQCSSAEQIRISVAIAMSANPTIRVLRIKDGSLLDDASLEIIAAMAESADYQVWIEKVDASGTVGIAIEDGSVVAVDGEPVTQDALAAVGEAEPTDRVA